MPLSQMEMFEKQEKVQQLQKCKHGEHFLITDALITTCIEEDFVDGKL